MIAPLSSSYNGSVFRLAPSGAADPADASYSVDPSVCPRGGRWHPRASYPTLYTALDTSSLRIRYRNWLRNEGVANEDLVESRRRAVFELSADAANLCDVVSDGGLTSVGLPTTYPYRIGHRITQPIGAELHRMGLSGVHCRSSVRPPSREIAFFADLCANPSLVRRLFDDEWWTVRSQ